MSRIRGGAVVLGLWVGLAGSIAHAQQVTGKIVGRVVDKDSGQAVSGVTVIVQGPQGEDSSLSDGTGNYYFSTLPVGTYTIRFYIANSSSSVEQAGVIVSADKTVRVNARIASAAAAAASQQTYVINRKAPAIDVGTTRLGPTFDRNFMGGVPGGQSFGDIIEKAPGAFVDRTGSVSIGGATGLENTYLVDGLNVTGAEYGNIDTNAPSTSGGSNLPLDFMDQVSVSSGGYQAEFGGAMGGVISAVTKSGSNELHGSAFSYWSPYWLAGQPNLVSRAGVAISTLRKPDFDTTIGAEVGGPIIKNKLFFWVGFAPRLQKSHVFRYVNTVDTASDGTQSIGPEVVEGRRRLDENRNTYAYGAKLDYVPMPNHRLTLSLFGSPSSATGLRNFGGIEAFSNPTWARESVSRNTTDTMLRWVSKLFDRKWQIEGNVGLHRETFSDGSADPALNGLNQQEWWNTNLYDREGLAGCAPTASNANPCPIDTYHDGGFGQVKTFDSNRWVADVKSTHVFQAAGHHEVKYGWHLELTQFNQDRYYSGPLGARGLVIHDAPYGPASANNLVSQTFFTLQPGERPDQFVDDTTRSQLLMSPRYRDDLPADVKSLANAFFLQESYSPLPNLTFDVGARLEMQKMYDSHGAGFLSLDNLGPRLGAVYDPSNEGRSKVFVHYGRFYEAIPMNLAARYFGGEGILQSFSTPAACSSNPGTWTGNGEWRGCTQGNYNVYNNGQNYLVQPNLQGQYHNEVVAGVQHEIMEDLVAGVDYTHRWLGSIIEDGTGDPNTYTFVLANPGNVPQAALDDLKRRADAGEPGAQAQLDSLSGLAHDPKPERTYDALTLFVDKRFSRSWLVHASYTYSRLIGNYEGLYQEHTDYAAPNGSAAYDIPDMLPNARGPLPNDHPHSGRIDGFYQVPVGRGSIVTGLGFSARSGQPRNYYAALGGYGGVIHLLPRGSAGRTPAVTQFDLKIAYRRPLTPNTGLEAFIDVFNLFNQQAVLRTDDDYTYDEAAAIVNGRPEDLKYAKSSGGAPLTKNPNFGNATAYQAPIHCRLGVRLMF